MTHISPTPLPILIWGASGHATVVADAARATGRYVVAGFLDDLNPGRAEQTFCGATILGGREQLSFLKDTGVCQYIFGFGDCNARRTLADVGEAAGLKAAVVVHPGAIVSSAASLGLGTFVAAGAVVNTGASVGRHVIINTSASVDHDCEIGDATHICPGVRLAGGVTVGEASWVGIGSTVIEGVRIGSDVVIGAGSVVVRDIADGVLAFGVPARTIRRLSENRLPEVAKGFIIDSND